MLLQLLVIRQPVHLNKSNECLTGPQGWQEPSTCALVETLLENLKNMVAIWNNHVPHLLYQNPPKNLHR